MRAFCSRGERVAAPVHGQDQVGLFDHLLAVQVEVRVVQQQRVLVRRRCAAKSQILVAGEAVGLRVDAELLVVGDVHGRRRRPARRAVSSSSTPRWRGAVGVAADGVGGRAQVLLGHQVGVDVVVGDRAVLVGAGDAVDVELRRAGRGGPSERHSRAVSTSSSSADLALEADVAGGLDVADDGVGDVGVDVERGGAGRPVAGAFLAVDGAPRERGAGEAELAGALAWPIGRVECRQRSASAAASGAV